MTSSRPRVLIVTVNYQSPANTLETLASLRRLTYPAYEILVVDNGSRDGSLAAIRASGLANRVIALPDNLGFAGGYNFGLQHGLKIGAAYILIVNNDVDVAPDMLDQLVSVMDDERIAIAAPSIFYSSDPERIWSSGFHRHPLTLEMTGGRRGLRAPQDPGTPYAVDYLLGCIMLFNPAALRVVGLFDTRFYLYYEDLDLSTRMQKQGYRLYTVPRAQAWHKVAGSSGLTSPLRVYHMARGSVLFFRSHARRLQYPAITLYRAGSALRKLAPALFKRDIVTARAYLHGLRDGWLGACHDHAFR